MESTVQKINLDRHLETMLISAERYACGRKTYIVDNTVNYILALLPYLSDWCIGIMERDIHDQFAMAERSNRPDLIGDECDRQAWENFLAAVRKEQDHRKSAK